MDLKAIEGRALEAFGEMRSHPYKEAGNKFHHGRRVARLALTLRERLFPGEAGKDEILTVAAWLHDIKNAENEPDHCASGAREAAKLLQGLCTPEEIEEICAIIRLHDARKGDRSGFSNTLKLHQDADHLDHFGTFDVWAAFIYAVPNGASMDDVVEDMLKVQLLKEEKYRSEMNFDLSRRIYGEKTEFLSYFTARFQAESRGEIWRAEALLK